MSPQAKRKGGASVVKIGLSRQVAIPKKLHDKLGLSPGDYLRVELEGDRLVLTPQALVERRLAESLKDIQEGRVQGPFRSVGDLLRSLRRTKPSKSS